MDDARTVDEPQKLDKEQLAFVRYQYPKSPCPNYSRVPKNAPSIAAQTASLFGGNDIQHGRLMAARNKIQTGKSPH